MEQEYKGNERRKTNLEHICTKEDTIDAVAEDLAHVKGEIVKIQSVNDRTIETLERMELKLNSMDKRLFIDNGVTSVQTTLKNNENRMNNIENIIKVNQELTNTKIKEVADLPATYAKYTLRFLTVLGALCGLIIWIATHVV